jgi:3-oxoacyl-[acyl-carrier-protein] synthase-1
VTSVGLTAPAACAAIRAGISNPTETRFADSSGERIMAHQVMLEEPWIGRTKLVKMAARAMSECTADLSLTELSQIPLLLCVAERDRPGRLEGLDDDLFGEFQGELGVEFDREQSLIIPHGRVSSGVALKHARRLIYEQSAPGVLVVATDTMLTWPTLDAYDRDHRLLTPENSNGFMPGEGAAALMLSKPGDKEQLQCLGLGFSSEQAHINSGEPLRAQGLSVAIKEALADASMEMHTLDFRITDLSGEQYYFKEAALALSRILRAPRKEFDIWHPAECIGEVGAVAGFATLVVAEAACRKRYAHGPNILCHAGNDTGQRVATIVRYQVN